MRKRWHVTATAIAVVIGLLAFPRGSVLAQLLGLPPIQIGRVPGTGERGVCISVFMLQPAEERTVADRVENILRKATGR